MSAVSGTVNLRDVGGVPADAGRVRRGRLLRSDALHRIDDAGRETLRRLDVRRVVDLRDEDEIQAAPDALDGLAVEVLHRPILGDWTRIPAAARSLPGLYSEMITHRGAALAAAVLAIADASEGAVLVHCTAGKDRTGLVIALALSAVGTPREAVLDDYERTEANLAGEWLDGALAAIARLPLPEGLDIATLLGASPRAVLAATLDDIDAEYGSVAAYLQGHGFDAAALARLRAWLVDPN